MNYHPSDWTVQHYDDKTDTLRLRCRPGSDISGDLQIPVSRIDAWVKHSDNTYQVMIGGVLTGWFSATEADVQWFLLARAERLERKREKLRA